MMRQLGWGAVVLGLAVAGCSADKGAMGDKGDPGKDGTGAPSVSAVTPSQAYLGRTIDLTISGSGTSWTSAAQVSFADANIKVNKVTVASPSGIVANVTIGDDTALAPTDVTVTDGSVQNSYKGAFQIKAPLEVTVDQAGVPQGGIATVHVRMLDVTTPFDPAHTIVESPRKDLELAAPTAADFSLDFAVRADVLATVGDVDIKVSSGGQTIIGSPAKKAFAIAASTPAAITGGQASGMVKASTDTLLYQLTPAGETDRFVQIKLGSQMGAPLMSVLPKSGKYSASLSTFASVFGKHLASSDALYLVVQDGSNGNPFAPPPPYDFAFTYTETPVTVSADLTEAATNNDVATQATAVATLPGLVTGTLGYGTVKPEQDADYFKITVTGASAATPKSIHVATGGDGLNDAIIEVFGTDGTSSLNQSSDLDFHDDLVVDGIDTNGTYFVKVSASTAGYFNAAHNTYELFVEVK